MSDNPEQFKQIIDVMDCTFNLQTKKSFVQTLSVHTNVRTSFLVAATVVIMLLITTTPSWFWLLIVPSNQRGNESVINNTFKKVGERRQVEDFIEVSEILPNCGIRKQCPEYSFPVHIYTGQDKDDQPKLCISGKYLIGNNVNGGGRGLNAAIVEPVHFRVISVHNFDLYSQNSSSLELWLATQVLSNDIIIIFTFDEASKELSRKAKMALNRLGSGKIQDLQFRSQWYMISQKGIKGFTSLEKLNFAKNDHWGEVIDERICVPRKIPAITITPDHLPRKNAMREKFCQYTEEMKCDDFCGAMEQHEAIYPALLTNRSLIGNAIYSTPVIVVGGSNLATLSLTLQSLIHQPGIHNPSVLVLCPEGHEEMEELVRLFSFQPVPVNSTSNNEHIHYGLRLVTERFPTKKYAIVLDEGLIVSPDFLFYMAQLIFLFEKDSSILTISAWNPNGYKNVSSNTHLAYRSQHFPGLGFVIPLSLFKDHLDADFSYCCSQPTVFGWEIGVDGDTIMPDVSRVLQRPADILQTTTPDDSLHELFLHPRVTNVDVTAWIERPQELTKGKYFQQMVNLIQESITFYLSETDLNICEDGVNAAISRMIAEFSSENFAVYYHEMDYDNFTTLKAIVKCFGIFIPKDKTPQGLYLNVFRFTVDKSTIFLVESVSPFYRPKVRTASM